MGGSDDTQCRAWGLHSFPLADEPHQRGHNGQANKAQRVGGVPMGAAFHAVALVCQCTQMGQRTRKKNGEVFGVHKGFLRL